MIMEYKGIMPEISSEAFVAPWEAFGFAYRQPPAMLVENALASSIERSEMSFRA